MRYTLLAFLLSFISISAVAQDPATWKYTAIKIDSKTYEVHLTVQVQSPWHIYSQTTPDGGPKPTKIVFQKNPVLTLTGVTKEVGSLRQKHEEVFGVDVKYFDGKVDFVQTVRLKSAVKTNVSGTVEFMVCNDQQCLPPKVLPFSVKLN